jgi:lysozyme
MTVTELITRHEGKRLKPYTDTVGKLTIGVGRNLSDVGISDDECLLLLQHDIYHAIQSLSVYPWYMRLNDARQAAVIDLMFNVGAARFAGFKKMIAALELGHWDEAARQLLDSVYATQVGKRAVELAFMLEKGEWQV